MIATARQGARPVRARPLSTWFLAAALSAAPLLARAAETVTVDNFVRAATDTTFKRFASTGGFGQFLHIRQPTPLDRQDVIRMNRDTLYSAVVLDLAGGPATISKPASAGRFQSLLVINQDHSIVMVEHGTGEFTLTRDQVGTRYAIALIRTLGGARRPVHAGYHRGTARTAGGGRDEFLVASISSITPITRCPRWGRSGSKAPQAQRQP